MDIFSNKVLIYFNVFGMFPLKYENMAFGGKKLKFSLKLYYFHLSIVIVTCLVHALVGFAGHSHIFQAQDKIDRLTRFAKALVMSFMVIITFVSTSKQLNKLINFYNILQRFSNIFPEKLLYPQVKIVQTVLIFVLHIVPMHYIIFSKDKMERLFNIIYLIQYFTLTAVILQFKCICQMAVVFFKAITEELEREISWQTHALLIRDLEGYFPKMDDFKDNSFSAARVSSLIDLYWLLCEAVQLANSFYCCQLLAAVFSSFIHIIITLYYFFLQACDPNFSLTDVFYIIMQAMWTFVHISQLALLIWPSTDVTEAADGTAPMICKLINKEMNQKVRAQLELFLLQLLHHNARFSALGFFQIHRHVLTSIAGSVTTYLVILIQFQTAMKD